MEGNALEILVTGTIQRHRLRLAQALNRMILRLMSQAVIQIGTEKVFGSYPRASEKNCLIVKIPRTLARC